MDDPGRAARGLLEELRSADVPSRAAPKWSLPNIGRSRPSHSRDATQPAMVERRRRHGDLRGSSWSASTSARSGRAWRFVRRAALRDRSVSAATAPPSNPVTPGVVQSFGFLVAGMAKEAGGAGSFAHVIHDEGPGTNSRLRQRWRRRVALGRPRQSKGRSHGSGLSPLVMMARRRRRWTDRRWGGGRRRQASACADLFGWSARVASAVVGPSSFLPRA